MVELLLFVAYQSRIDIIFCCGKLSEQLQFIVIGIILVPNLSLDTISAWY